MVGAPFERAVAPIRSATVKNGRYVRRTGYRAYHVHSSPATACAFSLSVSRRTFARMPLIVSRHDDPRFSLFSFAHLSSCKLHFFPLLYRAVGNFSARLCVKQNISLISRINHDQFLWKINISNSWLIKTSSAFWTSFHVFIYCVYVLFM